MSEARLVVPALATWALAWCARTGHPLAGMVLLVVTVLALAGLSQGGQAIVTAACGVAGLVSAAARARRAEMLADIRSPGDVTSLVVAEAPTETVTGGWFLRARAPGNPDTLGLFIRDVPEPCPPGTRLAARLHKPADAESASSASPMSGELVGASGPEGLAAFAAWVSQTFSEHVAAATEPGAEGLIPAMVLGDTSLQTPADKQMYVDTGLAHLSAVSGSNVSTVTVTVVVICRLCGIGPRITFAAALSALAIYVFLVGLEPSVTRAGVMGAVGLVAVVGSRRVPPLHALSLAIIALVLWRSELATDFAFALSVVATAGIVVLFPLLHQALGRLAAHAPTLFGAANVHIPDVIVRAAAVAIAADMATMPIVALMSGKVSLVGVVANLAVEPVVAPITVLGLAAVVCCVIGSGLPIPLLAPAATLAANALLAVVEPLAQWIHTVATVLSSLPLASVPAHPITALLAYAWMVGILLVLTPHPLTLAVRGAERQTRSQPKNKWY